MGGRCNSGSIFGEPVLNRGTTGYFKMTEDGGRFHRSSTMSAVERDVVRCMQHCTNEMNIFFTNFPETCPICGKSLRCCSLMIPPFRVPCPFVSQKNVSRVILVKPTRGSFMR